MTREQNERRALKAAGLWDRHRALDKISYHGRRRIVGTLLGPMVEPGGRRISGSG